MRKLLLIAALGAAFTGWQAPARSQTIPIIVKDTTSFYW